MSKKNQRVYAMVRFKKSLILLTVLLQWCPSMTIAKDVHDSQKPPEYIQAEKKGFEFWMERTPGMKKEFDRDGNGYLDGGEKRKAFNVYRKIRVKNKKTMAKMSAVAVKETVPVKPATEVLTKHYSEDVKAAFARWLTKNPKQIRHLDFNGDGILDPAERANALEYFSVRRAAREPDAETA